MASDEGPDHMQGSERLSLKREGKDVVLRQVDAEGNRSAIRLSENNFRTLALSARQLLDRILAERSRRGANVMASIRVAQCILNTDLHKSVILLTMVDPNGEKMSFEIPPDVGRQLSDRLPALLAKTQEPRTKQ